MTALSDKQIYKGKENPFDEAAKGARALLDEMDKVIVKGKEVSDALKLDIKSNKKSNSEDLKKLTDQTSKLGTATKAGNEIIKEKQRLEVTLKKLNSDKIQQNEQLKVQVQVQRKLNKDLAKDQLKLIGAFEKLTKKTNEAQKKFKNLAVEFGENSKQAKSARKDFEKLDNRLSKVNKAARDGRRDVGQYAKGWQGLKKLFVGGLGILGVTAGFSAIRSGITKLVSTFSEFQKQVSKVGAISGASGNDLKALTAQAQALGEATEKTASEVAQLQLELAKLGFDPKQIQDATDSILDLSTAVDADLGESAKVVGATLRAFGLDAEETGRVTDVMALSFSRSSLDIAKFSQAMSTVAPVAKAFGFSIEETTSLLAQLTDAGFDASAAGTATRNILLNLADTNGELAKRLGGSVDNMEDLLLGLEKLNDEGVDLNETLQLTDKRSVAAFNRFINATDQTRKLTKELESAEGAASRMAKIMRDNLAGDTDKAKSAMQGLFINIGNRLNPALRESVQSFTGLVGKLNELVKIKASEEIENEREQVVLLVSKLQDANTSYEDRVTLLRQLNSLAPDVVKGINAEEIAYEDLNKQLDAYLENTIQRIALAQLEAERIEELTNIADLRIKQAGALATAQEILVDVANKFRVAEGSLQDQISGTIDLLRKEVDAQEASGEAGRKWVNSRGTAEDTRTEEQKQLLNLTNIWSFYNTKQQEANEISETTIANVNEKIKILKEQLGIVEDLNEEGEKEKNTTEDLTNAVIEYTEALERLQGVASKGVEFSTKANFDLRTDTEKLQDKLFAENIKREQELTQIIIDEAIKRNDIIEGLESEHYDSLLDIAFNYANRKKAQDESLSSDELQTTIDSNQKTQDAVTDLVNSLISLYNQYASARLNQLQTDINNQNQAISEQESLIDRQIQLQKEGAAHSVKTEQDRLEKLQDERDKNLKKQKELQKEQDRVNTLTQISALVTAVANVIAGYSEIPIVGVLLGLAAAASLVTGFIATKSDAESSVSAEDGNLLMKKGNYIESGKRHSAGGNKYTSAEFQEGEAHAIFSREKTSKYGDEISDFYHAIDSDRLDLYKYGQSSLSSNDYVINNDYSSLLNEVKNTNAILQKQTFVKFDKNGKARFYNILGQLKEIHV